MQRANSILRPAAGVVQRPAYHMFMPAVPIEEASLPITLAIINEHFPVVIDHPGPLQRIRNISTVHN